MTEWIKDFPNHDNHEYVLVSEEELKMLFLNEEQRELFRTILKRFVSVIIDRTTLHGIKLHF